MRFQKGTFFKWLGVPILGLLLLFFLPSKNLKNNYQYVVGKPWKYDILVAKQSFSVYKSAQQLDKERGEVYKKFVPYYVLDSSFSSLMVVSPSEKENWERSGYKKIYVVKGKTASLCPVTKIYTPRSAYQLVHKDIIPNLHYDSLTSSRVLKDMIDQISMTRGMIQSGERVIDHGELVTEEKYQILNSMFNNVNNTQESRFSNIVGTYGIILIFLSLFLLYLRTFRMEYYNSWRDLAFFVLITLILNIIGSLSVRYNDVLEFAIPLSWIPILVQCFYDSRTALFLHLTNIMLLSCMVSHPFIFLLMQTIGGIIVIISLKNLTRRSQLIGTASLIVISYCVTYIFLTWRSSPMESINPYVFLLIVLNGIFIMGSYGLIYVFEQLFKKTSDITLVEISDLNSRLLLELAEKAPGTFQHSIQVSTLANDGARSIHANFLLVRTAALYHDIGKLNNSWFFTENQRNDYNPLIEKEVGEAVEIIKQHVPNGVSIAKQYNLPGSIHPFIKSHHGTSPIRYFYNLAVNEAQKRGDGSIADVDIDSFRYPGPKPQTKEEAILMMADVIEARSRSLKEFSQETVKMVVNETINTQIADGQFNETNLSFNDVERLKTVFAERLISMNQTRISYPQIESKRTLDR